MGRKKVKVITTPKQNNKGEGVNSLPSSTLKSKPFKALITRPATLTTTLYVYCTDRDEAAFTSLDSMNSIPLSNYEVQFDLTGDIDFDVEEVSLN